MNSYDHKFLNLKIAHLYPKHMNIYGDMGNIITLVERCRLREIKVDVFNIDINEDIKLDKYDLYFMGGGQDSQQRAIAKDLKTKKEILQNEALINKKVFLGICGGYQLFGKYYKPFNNELQEGLSILDVKTIASNKRFIGNVTAKITFLDSLGTLVGFENHSGLTYIEENSKTIPLAKVVVGHGNNGEDKLEGARKNNVFGTYLHGSLLPKNPIFADYLIKIALDTKYDLDINLKQLNDSFENKLHLSLENKSY